MVGYYIYLYNDDLDKSKTKTKKNTENMMSLSLLITMQKNRVVRLAIFVSSEIVLDSQQYVLGL